MIRESLWHEVTLEEDGMELIGISYRRRDLQCLDSIFFLLVFAKNSLRGHRGRLPRPLPPAPSPVYTPLTSRGDFRAINAGGGGGCGKEIFGGLTSNAEEKGRERELRG